MNELAEKAIEIETTITGLIDDMFDVLSSIEDKLEYPCPSECVTSDSTDKINDKIENLSLIVLRLKKINEILRRL